MQCGESSLACLPKYRCVYACFVRCAFFCDRYCACHMLENLVIQVAQAATETASEAAARAAQAAAIAAAFPLLPGGRHTSSANADEPAEAAFSDEEGPLPAAKQQQQPGAALPRVEVPANSFSSDGAASALAGDGHGVGCSLTLF